MPKAIEEKLKKQARKMAAEGKLHKIKGKNSKQEQNAYVYGTLNKLKQAYNVG